MFPGMVCTATGVHSRLDSGRHVSTCLKLSMGISALLNRDELEALS